MPVLIFFMNPICIYDDVTIAMCSHFRGLLCPWARTDGFCRIETKLVSLSVRVRNLNPPSFSVETKQAVRSLPYHIMHPCLSLLLPLPCSLWPVDKLMNPGATSTGRRERKYGWTAAIALGSTSKCLNKGGSHGVSSPYLCPQAFSQARLKRSFQHHHFACHGSPSVAPDFLWLCSRELNSLFWKW